MLTNRSSPARWDRKDGSCLPKFAALQSPVTLAYLTVTGPVATQVPTMPDPWLYDPLVFHRCNQETRTPTARKAPGTCQELRRSEEGRPCGMDSTWWQTGSRVSLPRYNRYGSASKQELKFITQKFMKGLSNHNRLTFLWKIGRVPSSNSLCKVLIKMSNTAGYFIYQPSKSLLPAT